MLEEYVCRFGCPCAIPQDDPPHLYAPLLHNLQRFLSGFSGIKVYSLYMPLWEQGRSCHAGHFILSIVVHTQICAVC